MNATTVWIRSISHDAATQTAKLNGSKTSCTVVQTEYNRHEWINQIKRRGGPSEGIHGQTPSSLPSTRSARARREMSADVCVPDWTPVGFFRNDASYSSVSEERFSRSFHCVSTPDPEEHDRPPGFRPQRGAVIYRSNCNLWAQKLIVKACGWAGKTNNGTRNKACSLKHQEHRYTWCMKCQETGTNGKWLRPLFVSAYRT